LVIIVAKVKPEKDVPSWSWLKTGLARLVHSCTFHYPDFKLTPYEMSRISSQMETLHLQGKLTRKAKRDRHWLVSGFKASIVSAAFRNNLDKGVLSWDVALAKTNLMVFTFALACRIGEITKGERARHEMAFLAYQDVHIRLALGDRLEDLVMVVTLRNQKGGK
jgi:hypothetical protein